MSTTSITRGRHRKALLAAEAILVAAALVVLASSPALAATSTVQDADREHTQYGRWMFTQDPGASGGWESLRRRHAGLLRRLRRHRGGANQLSGPA